MYEKGIKHGKTRFSKILLCQKIFVILHWETHKDDIPLNDIFHMPNMTADTICALATPAGGAIATIRLSGPDAISIADRIFSPASKRPLAEAKGGTLHYGTLHDAQNATATGAHHGMVANEHGEANDSHILDDVVVSLYRAPHSYTGENCVEISCHGSRYIMRQILLTLQACGARQAEPGEYTRRAYLNGKMDLSQAEAVADIIASSSRASHDLAISQLRGHVRTALEELRERLQKLTALLELELDFSDHDDLEFADRNELQELANEIGTRLSHLADTYHTGKAIKEGIPVAIVGKPNVGKSTLLNRLLGEERAIVSDVPGTTRDSIEDTVEIGGLTFRFIDTAGLRQTNDKIEQIGIERAYSQLDRALIVVWLIDALPTADEIADIARRSRSKRIVIAANKCDLNSETANSTWHIQWPADEGNHPQDEPHRISAKDGTNMEQLKEAILKAADIPQVHEGDAIITSARQYSLLQESLTCLGRVTDGLRDGLPTDLVAEDLRLVINHLADITGMDRISTKSTLDLIFSSFCIGK